MSKANRVITLAGSTLLVLSAAMSARADDTEIFTMTPPTSVNTRPNILFIVDTSGSMATQVVDKEPYDPSVQYPGTVCTRDRIYWKQTGWRDMPTCGGDQWFSASNMACKTAADKIAELGNWSIRPAASWRSGKKLWDQLASGSDRIVECQADAAIGHGQAAGDNKVPADGNNGPFSSTASQSIQWTGNKDIGYTFYSGNYLNWYYNAPATNLGTRLRIVQNAAKDTLGRLSNVNVGLMRFSSDADGGMVLHEMAPIETARTTMNAEIDALSADGNTPLSETMMEAYRYWAGLDVHYGLDSRVGLTVKPSVDASRTGTGLAQYRSPLGNACQKNFIVYLTDGDPTSDTNAEPTIEGLPNFSTLGNLTTGADNGGQCSDNGASDGSGRCLDDLARYMYQKDFVVQMEDGSPDPDQPKENIRTYTIGFGSGMSTTGLALLQSTANNAGGSFYAAADSASLTEAFNNIISEVMDENISFTSPAVSVNAFNRTQNLNDLFITVFKPDENYHWPGNLKKYRLTPSGLIVDARSNPAVDEDEGFFRDAAQSFWSADVDGADVPEGGAAHKLPAPDQRDLYTDLAALAGTPGGDSLNAAGNLISTANTAALTPDLLGVPPTALDPDPARLAEATTLINWMRGLDTDLSTRFEMGDPLHSRPVSVIYGGTATAPDAVVYVATNDGFLHAIDPSTGVEMWAYVPSELLGRTYDLNRNAASASKRYGLDGNLVAYRIDQDGDGVIETGDKVYLFFGMGRGGDNYYALDVTNKESPKFMWRNGADFEMTGAGQTWSTPVIAKVNIGGTDKLVVIVGGGYDETQDAVPYNTDVVGNHLYMLDAVTGRLLWSGGPSGPNFTDDRMTNSIPADVRVLDMTNDGLADRMYTADTGGRIWRFDISNGQSADNLVKGGVFASLGAAIGSGGTGIANARRFYVAPDVSLLRADGRFYINLAIGSGYRGHPLNTEIHDAFYSLRDPSPFVPISDYSTVTPILHTSTNLIDVTTNINPTIPSSAAGWKIELSQPSWGGEKVLAEARTFNGAILFPTYKPIGNTVVNTCSASAGTNYLYIVSALDGRPTLNRDNDATLEVEDRVGRLDQSGIAPPAAVFFPTPDPGCVGEACTPPPVCLVGVEQCGISFTNNPVKTFWNNQDTDVAE
jgi:type IV pilus assembly protein PilY1